MITLIFTELYANDEPEKFESVKLESIVDCTAWVRNRMESALNQKFAKNKRDVETIIISIKGDFD